MNINKLLKLASFYFKIAATNPYAPKNGAEAKRILDISDGTRITEDLIQRKFKQAIKIHHPDVGGDPEMTKKIIAARDYLLIYTDDFGSSGLDEDRPAEYQGPRSWSAPSTHDVDDPDDDSDTSTHDVDDRWISFLDDEIMRPFSKVVINRCWGGFSLSSKAIKWLIDHGGYDIDEKDWHSVRDIPRHDPWLVKCVEELGSEANGPDAALNVVQLRGHVYAIHEYDGWESVLYPDDPARWRREDRHYDYGERPDYDSADWIYT